jgi:hypothetical protein
MRNMEKPLGVYPALVGPGQADRKAGPRGDDMARIEEAKAVL